MVKRIILTILLVIWMLIIFMFSNDNSQISENKSDKVAESVVHTGEVITKKEVPKQEKKKLVKNSRVFVRKTAHFVLYFVLGGLVYFTLNSYGLNKKLILISLLSVFLYSLSDETHQIFTSGRTFKVLDIIIDTSAGTISILLSKLISRKKY